MKSHQLCSLAKRLFVLALSFFVLIKPLLILMQKLFRTAKPLSSLLGTWQRDAAGAYIAASHTLTLNANGCYQMSSSSYSQIGVTATQHSGTYELFNDRIIFTPNKHSGYLASSPPPATLTFRWRVHKFNDGKKLQLLSNASPQNWINADTFSRQK